MYYKNRFVIMSLVLIGTTVLPSTEQTSKAGNSAYEEKFTNHIKDVRKLLIKQASSRKRLAEQLAAEEAAKKQCQEQLKRIEQLEVTNEKLERKVIHLEKCLREIKSSNVVKLGEAATEFALDVKRISTAAAHAIGAQTRCLATRAEKFITPRSRKFLQRCGEALDQTFQELNT